MASTRAPTEPPPPTRPRAPRLRYALVALVLVLAGVGAVVIAANTDPSRLGLGAVDPERLAVGPQAPGLEGDTGWVNSPALGKADLAGKVVVYDFWTYSCVNCVRTLPYLRAWYERYRQDGLVIVGVHTPEFDFEWARGNVESATRRLGVAWPVVMDNAQEIWNRFANQYWPTKYVADRSGRLRYKHIGEGGYEETEGVLRALLEVDPASPRAAHAGADRDDEASAAAARNITAETYLGTRRGTAGARTGEMTYPEPGPLAVGEAALAGHWRADEQSVTAREAGAAIVLSYRAREVNLVLARPSGGGGVFELVVELDGQPLAAEHRTADTLVDASGATTVRVDHNGLYRLVLAPGVGEHVLRLTARTPGVAAFAFTFGT